jgi:hypothetical protein
MRTMEKGGLLAIQQMEQGLSQVQPQVVQLVLSEKVCWEMVCPPVQKPRINPVSQLDPLWGSAGWW